MDHRYLLAATCAAVAAVGCSELGPTTAPTELLRTGAEAQFRTTPASASSIRIVQGAIVVDFAPSGSVSIRGTRGFTFEASSLGEGQYPGRHCIFEFCVPGTPISLGGFWVHPDIRGLATLQGQRLDNREDVDLFAVAIQILASVTAPPEASQATVTAPFTMEGQFDGAPLTGQGTVTTLLEWVGEGWLVRSARYEFRGGPVR